MTIQEKKDHLKLAISLMSKYNKAVKPEKYVNSLTNYNKGVLLAILFYKKQFPKTWKDKFIDATH